MEQTEWIDRILAGHVVTDVGQLDAWTRQKLNRMQKDGHALRGKSFEYPVPKVFWVAKGYTGKLPGPLDP